MKNQLLKSPILPIISLITYICCSYLFNSLIGFNPVDESLLLKVHFIDPLTFFLSFFTYHLVSPTLAIVLVTLLFTLQHPITLKNIGATILIVTVFFIFIKLLFFFLLPLRYFFSFTVTNHTTTLLLLMIRSMSYLTVFIVCLGFFIQYFLTTTQRPENTITIQPIFTQAIIASFYSLFIIITFASFMAYSIFQTPYTFDDNHQIYLLIIAAISFFYLYAWVFEHLKPASNLNNYAIITIKAYGVTMLLHILFATVLFAILWFIKAVITQHTFNLINSVVARTYLVWVFFLIIASIVFIILLAKASKNNLYKAIHYLFFIGLTGLSIVIAISLNIHLTLALSLYTILLFTTSVTLGINYLFTKLALQLCYKIDNH